MMIRQYLRKYMIAKALLFFNPKSGHSEVGSQWGFINKHFLERGIELHTIFVPLPDEVIKAIIDSAISVGVDLFIAAGGDGTVSLVGTHLVGKKFPLGIIPLGTGNLLSKSLRIPQKIDQALELITDKERSTVKIDTLYSNDRHFLMNISVGVSPKVMGIGSDQKQKYGTFAYIHNLIQEAFNLKTHRVNIEIDGKNRSYHATEVLITNIKTAGIDPLTWSEDILLDDGVLDLLIIKAQSFSDLAHLILSVFKKSVKTNPEVKFLKVNKYCRIETQFPLKTQADGDVFGHTPIEVHVAPQSLAIIAGIDYELQKQERGKNENI